MPRLKFSPSARHQRPAPESIESPTLSAYIRVNQVGYVETATKQAVLLASGPETGAAFQVLDSGGQTVYSAPIGANLGKWNNTFPDTYLLDFSSVTTPGTYSLVVTGPIAASSPQFAIGTGSALYSGLLSNALFFYQAQRDGPDVNPAVMDRQPSHLNDEQAYVYNTTLQQIGGPIDVSGGWFDAGDYLKFVETASYTVAVMLLAVRDYPDLFVGGSADFASEAQFGLNWLQKMWNDQTKTLYYQVGLGQDTDGSVSDHDVWRLPQDDDGINLSEYPKQKFLKYRPVFQAASPGAPISPNLAGRMAADFALGYQVYNSSDPAYADQLLRYAEDVYALADTTDKHQLTTTWPYNFYPQTSWQADMELAATELYFALAQGNPPAGLPETNPSYYLTQAATWAKAYINHYNTGGTDSLNLYDVSGLAHYELYRAMTQAGNPSGLAVSQSDLLTNLNAQLSMGTSHAKHDPFGLGIAYAGGNDLVPHALGYVVEAALYGQLTGTTTYNNFGQTQLNWVLGNNAWGTTFVVGAGSTFPYGLQSQIANLVGTLNGTPPILLGAVVDGPNMPSGPSGVAQALQQGLPDGLNGQPDAHLYPAGTPNPFKSFDTGVSTYVDDPRSWPTSEPSDDYTVLTLLAFALQIDGPPS
jgi:endoglucanase